MTIKKQHTIVTLTPQDGPFVDQNIDTLYRNKIEARYFTTATSVTVYPYQSLSTGDITFPCIGATSQTAITVPLPEKLGVPLFAHVNVYSINRQYSYSVIDLTQTSITISIFGVVGTALNNLQGAMSGCSIHAHYIVIGASP